MFCRNCGKPLEPQAVVCLSCGARPGSGAKFCQHCGAETDPAAYVCVRCGVKLEGAPPGARSRVAAGLLGIFLGGLGVHRFYLGYTGIGVVQLLLTFATCGIASLWGFIEGVVLLCGAMDRDADGQPLGP
jgi:TM2 domain-containing membrane protein YozV